MNSFTEIANKRKKDMDKFAKKSFKGVAPKRTSTSRSGRAIGGAAPASIDALNRIQEIEDNIANGELDNPALEARLDTAEQKQTTTDQNISALDNGIASLSSQIGTLSTGVNNTNTRVDSVLSTLNGKANVDHTHMQYMTPAQVTALVASILANTGVTDDPNLTGSPTIAAGQYGSTFTYTQTWSDYFTDETAATLFNRWAPDLMDGSLHKTGNNGRDGWRHSAFYEKPKETAFVTNNALHMRAYVEEKPNPYRKEYTWRGLTLHPEDVWINLAFLSTWRRVWSNEQNRFITDPNSPDRTWGPGTCFNFKVDLTDMRTQCCRLSFWLFPAYENDSNAYGPDGTRGVEVDLTEVDPLNTYENISFSKVLSGRAAGNSLQNLINLAEVINGYKMNEGEHTFTLLWQKDKLVWYVDGIEIARDVDPRRIPQTPHYWIISREANSGIRDQRNDGVLDDNDKAYSDGTELMPPDPGLWGRPVYEEIDNLNNDTARVLAFESFTFNDTSTAGVGVGDDTSGISPVMLGANPPTDFTAGTTHTFSWSPNGRGVTQWYLEVGKSRGGTEFGSYYKTALDTSATVTFNENYNGPVNARLWFRADANDVWHWRDYGFSSGLQPYAVGTDGKVRCTVPAGEYDGTAPTVGGLGNLGIDVGRDGTYANSIFYDGGVVPDGYNDDPEPETPTVGVVGAVPPPYETLREETLDELDPDKVLTYAQYPNLHGELLWPSPVGNLQSGNLYELVINGLIVYRGTGNSFLFNDMPASNVNQASVRVVDNEGNYGPAKTLTFSIFVV